jgi:hypothetical protein
MKTRTMNLLRAAVTATAALALAGVAHAQTPNSMKPIVEDARSHLAPGFKNAAMLATNMEFVGNAPTPKGFTNPDYVEGAAAPAGRSDPRQGGGPTLGLTLSNSDIVFSKGRVVQGNFSGFNIFDVSNPKQIKLLASVFCPGGQGDVSIMGNLVFFSAQEPRGRLDCGTNAPTADVSTERFRGVRVFDISDLKNIRQVAAIQTCRGSHTHTLVPDPKDPRSIYIWNQGTSGVRPAAEMAGCNADEKDPNSSYFSIDVIKMSLDHPADAKIVNSPRIFADEKTGEINGLWKGGDYGPGTQPSRVTNQCHDITVYPAMHMAAGACSGNGIILDISDPVHPKRLSAVSDPNFTYWHAAMFSNDAKKVVYTDEWGGGTQPRCRISDPANWGGDIVFDIGAGAKMTARSIYKLPSAQGATENCVAHNGGIVPVPGRDIVVQAWYQGGISVFDITDSAHPQEIASFDRGPIDATQALIAGTWGAYWWNGHIYGAEMARGLDVLSLKASQYLTANEVAAAELVHQDENNPQTQQKIVWPNKPVVGRAYLDQLNRDKAVTPARAAEITKALDAQGSASAVALAGQLDKDAAKANGKTAERLAGIAQVLRAKA